MKKFLALMCSVLVLCLLSFAGCSDGWTEVQSITYSVGGETTTISSTEEYPVKIKFLDNGEIEISYYWRWAINPDQYKEATLRIRTESYEITYSED